jgi:hypothetical protein
MNKYILNIDININKTYFIKSILNIISTKINQDLIIKNSRHYFLDNNIEILLEYDEINNYFYTNCNYDYLTIKEYSESILRNIEYNIKLVYPEFSNNWTIEYNSLIKD